MPGIPKEQGATIVEASLVLPVMILILIGTLELGLAFKDYLTVSYASREGARVGALAGDDPNADCAVIHSVVDLLGGASSLDDLNGIQIYEADPATGDPIVANTNRWTYIGSDPYDCANDWLVVENWPSSARQLTFGPTSDLDILGVQVVYTHNWVTGFPPFSGSITVDEHTITRMEPEAFE